jgi:hypothetical protein
MTEETPDLATAAANAPVTPWSRPPAAAWAAPTAQQQFAQGLGNIPPNPGAAPPPAAPVNPLTAHVQQAAADPGLQARLQQAFGGAYVPPKPQLSPLRENLAEHEKTSAGNVEALSGEQRANLDARQKIQDTVGAIGDVQAKQQKDDAAFEAEGKGIEAQVNAETDQRHAGILDHAAKVRQMHVDPAKWYKDKGTAGTIAAALAQAAGAFAAGMPHGTGKNTAMDIIQGAIDKDVDAQKGDIDNQWKAHEDMVADDQREYAKGMHKVAQQGQRRIVAYDHAQAQIGQLRAGMTDQAGIAALDHTNGELERTKNLEKDKQADLGLSVAQKEAAQQAAAANGANIEEKKLNDEERKLRMELTKSPNAQIEEAVAKGMTREEAIARTARATVRGDFSKGGSLAVKEAGKGSEGKVSPRLRQSIVAGQQGEKAAAELVKLNPYHETGNAEAQSRIAQVEEALNKKDPGGNHKWLHYPASPVWKTRMADTVKQLNAWHTGLSVPGAPEPLEDDSVPGAKEN